MFLGSTTQNALAARSARPQGWPGAGWPGCVALPATRCARRSCAAGPAAAEYRHRCMVSRDGVAPSHTEIHRELLGGRCACSLTPRSSGAPTAGHQGPAGGTRYIFAVRALASCRRRPLSSNVRHHERGRAVVKQSQRLRRELNSHEKAGPHFNASLRVAARQRGRRPSPNQR